MMSWNSQLKGCEMRTCYLHVGMPKTGSTSIQKVFQGYCDARLEYASMTKSNHGGVICLRFSSNPKRLRLFRNRDISSESLQKRVARATEEYERATLGERDIIISGETIIRQLSPRDIDCLYQDLRSRFDRVITIAYVRPVAHSIVSQTQQVIRMGSSRLAWPSPRFRDFFNPIIRNSKREDLVISRFDRADLFGGDIVQDFAHQVGAQVDIEAASGRANEGLSSEALGTFLAYNKFVASYLPLRQANIFRSFLYKSLQGSGEIKFGLPKDLVEHHITKHDEDISWLEEITGFDLRGQPKQVSLPIRNEEQLLSLAAPLPIPDATVSQIYDKVIDVMRENAPATIFEKLAKDIER